MRLTVNLEHDLYVVARSLASADDCSISAAVNKLVRRALEPSAAAGVTGRSRRSKSDVNLLPVVRGERPFTSEDVYRIEESYS
jgi:hypothetical protein